MSSSSLNGHASPVAVLVSVRVDPVSGRATRSRADAAGAALALQALQARATLQGRSHAAQPRLLHAACRQSAMPEAVARDYLALGIDRLERLELAAADPEHITAALAEACHDTPLVIAGARGESGLASGLLPHRLAQRLQRPLIAEVIDLQPEADGGWRVVQALPRGARRSWRLERGAAGGSSAAPPRCWSAASAWHGARICACATPGWPRSRAASRTAAPHPARAPARWWWRPRPGHPSRPGASADRLHPSRPRAARRAWPAPPAPQPRRDRAARC